MIPENIKRSFPLSSGIGGIGGIGSGGVGNGSSPYFKFTSIIFLGAIPNILYGYFSSSYDAAYTV
jgi:hypothetical protein